MFNLILTRVIYKGYFPFKRFSSPSHLTDFMYSLSLASLTIISLTRRKRKQRMNPVLYAFLIISSDGNLPIYIYIYIYIAFQWGLKYVDSIREREVEPPTERVADDMKINRIRCWVSHHGYLLGELNSIRTVRKFWRNSYRNKVNMNTQWTRFSKFL